MAHNSNPLFPIPDVLGDLTALLGQHPSPETPLSYGTAGFRGPSHHLHEAVFRCAILAACRSHSQNGLPVGLMITASHNPQHDNGVKLIEPDGSMLSSEWESAASLFIASPPQSALSSLSHLVDISAVAQYRTASVLIGHDTRPSSPLLVDIATQAASALGASVEEMGILTTPQLHFCVRSRSRGYPDATPFTYAAELRRQLASLLSNDDPTLPRVVVDCACGVGAYALKAISLAFPAILVNQPEEGVLNEECGADFVQKNRHPPKVWSDDPAASFDSIKSDAIWASLDGDADRMVLFKNTEDGRIILADGDRLAVMVSDFLSRHLIKSKMKQVRMAVAQTAYSNGAATEFLRNLENVEIVVAKTGVKHLEKAVKPFDIGVYWEPNGHGTVLFQDSTVEMFQKAWEQVEEPRNDEEKEMKESLSKILAVAGLANQAVGDGVADLLLVVGILQREGKSFEDIIEMYPERSSASAVVKVQNKDIITTSDFDRVVDHPSQLREAIERITAKSGCRAFVRPSGTEDIVRVYAEAPAGEADKAKSMADEIRQAVFDICGGCQ